jgi:transmembrane sensor
LNTVTMQDSGDTDVPEAQVTAWMVRLRSGKATAADIEAFRRWRAEHPERTDLVDGLSDVWGTMGDAMREIAAEEPETADFWQRGTSHGRMSVRVGRRAFVGFAVAAGASWLALRPPLGMWPSLADLGADYRTHTGEQRRVSLSDQVVVEMNTQTRIDILRAQNLPRGIKVLAGEAEIITTPQPVAAMDTVFTVVAGRGKMQAQRARFDVRREANEVCVTCVSGAVSLDHPARRLTLTAGQQLIYDDQRVRPISTVDPSVVTAWRRGLLVFNGVPLAQVVDEINRYRPGKLILSNAGLGQKMVDAELPLAQLDDAIDLLGKLYGARVMHLPDNIALLS